MISSSTRDRKSRGGKDSFRSVLPIGVLFLLGACAGTTVLPVADDADAKGIRYYSPAPFLLVYSDGKDGHVAELVVLPDQTTLMSARPYAYLSSNKTTLEFENGMLTSAVEIIDTTTIPSAVIAGLKDIAIAKAQAFRKDPADQTKDFIQVPTPYLYKIVKDGNTWKLYGGNREPESFQIKASHPTE